MEAGAGEPSSVVGAATCCSTRQSREVERVTPPSPPIFHKSHDSHLFRCSSHNDGLLTMMTVFSSVRTVKYFPSINLLYTDIYGDIKDTAQAVPIVAAGGNSATVELHPIIHLPLCDLLPAHVPIVDLTIVLTRDGVGGLSTFALSLISLPATLIPTTSHPTLPLFTCFFFSQVFPVLNWWRQQAAGG